MSNLVKVNKMNLEVKVFKGQRVVTFKDIDNVHQRPSGTAGRNFRKNKKHFIENEDYFVISPSKFQSDEIRCFGISSPKGGFLITETGYLMLVKSLTDDLAWSVQRELVKNYFRAKEQPQENQSCTPTQKLYKGQPVAIIQDISRITGFSKGAIRHVINKNCSVFDYKVLKGTELLHFKSENHLQKRLHSLIIIFESGVKKLAKIYRFQPTDLFDSPKLPTVPVREYPPQKLSFMDELKMKSFIMNDLGMSKSIKLNYYYDTFRKFGIDIQFLKNIGAEVRIQQSALELGKTIVNDLTKEEAQEIIEDLKNNPDFMATSQLAQDYTIEFINRAIVLKEDMKQGTS